jgi:hypothetical protein
MLLLRPNCEWCDCDLPPESPDARICTYECTYCAHCVDNVLHNVCATCGGGFVPRPIRPKKAYRDTLKLGLLNDPATLERKHTRWTRAQVDSQVAELRSIHPRDR